MKLLDATFVDQHWRPRRPLLLRGAADTHLLVGVERTALFELCAPPVIVDVNVCFGGEVVRRRLPSSAQAPLFYQRYQNEDLIVYVFGLAKVSPAFAELEPAFEVGFSWRRLASFAAVAAPRSRIALHADLMDTFVVQLTGRRRWRWWPTTQDATYLRHLHRRRPAAPPLEPGALAGEAVLEPGDVLYLPACWPHEAETVGNEDAISVSVGWVALTPLRVLAQVEPVLAGQVLDDPRSDMTRWAGLLSDPLPGVDPLAAIADATWAALPVTERTTLDPGAFQAQVRALDVRQAAGLNL